MSLMAGHDMIMLESIPAFSNCNLTMVYSIFQSAAKETRPFAAGLTSLRANNLAVQCNDCCVV
jgi:hypothetical protein